MRRPDRLETFAAKTHVRRVVLGVLAGAVACTIRLGERRGASSQPPVSSFELSTGSLVHVGS
jgi:hypothetical protein